MMDELRKEAVEINECNTEEEIKDYIDGQIVHMANLKEVEKVYGKERGDAANYGWLWDGNVISTKVYGLRSGKPTMIVTTSWDGKKITHVHTKY
jgi:hypothetical protein